MDLFADSIVVIDEIIAAVKEISFRGCPGFEFPENRFECMAHWGSGAVRIEKCRPAETLERIGADIVECRRCDLCAGRNRIVFGSGNPNADLMFVGEGPGQEEDRVGEPFVGAAGQLLTKIIQAIHLNRSQVYICNIVKCRPPGNRSPLPEEIKSCRPFLKRQIAAVKPKFIVALGSVAAQALLDTDTPVSGLRGRFYEKDGVLILPTFHPAYLLRKPEKKREVWEDMKKLMAEMTPMGDRF